MTFAEIMVLIAQLIVGVAIFIDVYACIFARNIVDRVWSVDTLSAGGVSFIAIFSFRAGEESALIICIGLASVSFLGTICFARYLMFGKTK